MTDGVLDVGEGGEGGRCFRLFSFVVNGAVERLCPRLGLRDVILVGLALFGTSETRFSERS
jgi:hypothetical protein